MHDFMEIHTEAERNDGCLQQEFRQSLAFGVERVCQRESVNQSTQQRDRWREQAACCQNQPHEEDVLVHTIECGVATLRVSKH